MWLKVLAALAPDLGSVPRPTFCGSQIPVNSGQKATTYGIITQRHAIQSPLRQVQL